MSHFDPNALAEGPARALTDFAENSPAPAVLIEIARSGLSVFNATGTVTLGGETSASTDHAFEIGSQTKMMTSVVVQQLVGEGAINFDAPLADQMDIAGLEDIPNIQDVPFANCCRTARVFPILTPYPDRRACPRSLNC